MIKFTEENHEPKIILLNKYTFDINIFKIILFFTILSFIYIPYLLFVDNSPHLILDNLGKITYLFLISLSFFLYFQTHTGAVIIVGYLFSISISSFVGLVNYLL